MGQAANHPIREISVNNGSKALATAAERGFVERTSGATIVLLVFLAVMNLIAVILRRRFERRW